MKKKNVLLSFPWGLQVSLLVSFLSISGSSAAVKPSDFYCLSEPVQAFPIPATANNVVALPPFPTILGFKTAMRNCGGKSEVAEDICVMTARCTYLSDEIKKEMESEEQKPYARLKAMEKLEFLTAKANAMQRAGRIENRYTGLRTEMICQGRRGPNNKLICPPPEKCKGDMYHKAEFAQIDTDEITDAGFQPSDPGPANAGIGR